MELFASIKFEFSNQIIRERSIFVGKNVREK